MIIPLELGEDWRALTERWHTGALNGWLRILPKALCEGLNERRYGDLARWREAFAELPTKCTGTPLINSSRVGIQGRLQKSELKKLRKSLKGLHPWRKGPFELFGLLIESEWRSDWKWDRLCNEIESLKGRRVLDVGCGNGYHCWRILGEGASEVIGIDPSPLFTLQFKSIQHFLKLPNIHVLPIPLESVPSSLPVFDTVFSMGVLYHRRLPINHLKSLKNKLLPGGQLILETLIIEGEDRASFSPPGRYAKMNNVWHLPTPNLTKYWLNQAGFGDLKLIDISKTTTEEQRQTDWMTFHSLSDFLHPNDDNLTVEGHPAPLRAIFTAIAVDS